MRDKRKYIFSHDELTGLYTKEQFYRKVRACLKKHPKKAYTLLCCNLENFKWYNDANGREAGNQLLKTTAKQFKEQAGRDAICCRYEADRFLCLREQKEEAYKKGPYIDVGKNITVKLGVFEIKDRSLTVEQMCDRVLWVVDTIHGIYGAHIALYDEKMHEKVRLEQKLTEAMEEALKEKQFQVYFQPKYGLEDDRLIGAEALVRWEHPSWGVLAPNVFIPLFEKNGFICRLDEYVWESTCEKIKAWQDKGYQMVPVSVNVSRLDLYRKDLAEFLSEMVKKCQIAPSLLHLEITETAYHEQPEQMIETVEELRKKGFIIEMDDFGSGYSSLHMLARMSIDIVKLDMEFIRNEIKKDCSKSILGDIIHMAHRMKLKVIAEGVETMEQKQYLKTMDCDYAQGYYYAKALCDKEFEQFIEK